MEMLPQLGNIDIGAKATVMIQGHPNYGQWILKPSCYMRRAKPLKALVIVPKRQMRQEL